MARVLLLASTVSYRTDDFRAAAASLGVEVVLATDRCQQLAKLWSDEAFGSVEVHFRQAAEAARRVVEIARETPFDALLPTDEPTAEIAARAAARLGLRGNSVEAAVTARNKRLMRLALAHAGVPSPTFVSYEKTEDPARIAATFPCVVKPILCAASRGVIRANDPEQFVVAWQRLKALLDTPALRAVDDPDGHRILVEEFVPGPEVAVEGILSTGRLEMLALFDKPDPLDGPFFEETIYVTPSRHSFSAQQAIAETTRRACEAIGLVEGPVHAELRLAPSGPVVIEVAARSIGGLCARTLRFGLGAQSLEEAVILHALGRPFSVERQGAAGVMMIPIPKGGVLQKFHGVEAAKQVALVEDVQITAKIGQVLQPLPEGHAYLGFIFARGEAPDAVESALREAHARLSFEIATRLQPRF